MDKELKEKIADLLNRKRPSVSADQIIALIKFWLSEELDKMEALSDKEADKILEAGFNTNTKPESMEHLQRMIQLNHTKDQLLKRANKELR